MPALLTQMSSRPVDDTARSASAEIEAWSLTSRLAPRCLPPKDANSAAVSFALASSRSPITSVAPASARRLLIARPMPAAPPVTTAVRPRNEIRLLSERSETSI